MEIMELLKSRRTYRRFEQKPVEDNIVNDILTAARYASSAANRQPLSYVVVRSPEIVKQVFDCTKWAGYFPDDSGRPKSGEEPVMFIGIVENLSINRNADTDAGLAICNMTLAAWSHGVGSCIIGACDRTKLSWLFHLTEDQAKKVEAMRKAITADVDKKTGITTVTVTLQDPMVTAAITDTVVVKLQEYITAYRVSKAQQDCAYLEQLYKERQQEYYVAQQNYANYMDANKGVVLQSALTERERLQNDMNLAYQVYSQVATQLQVARAKVQEAKPVFAVVEPASVPLLPSGTSKKVILVGFIFLAVAGASAWILFGREFFENLKAGLNAPQEGMEKK